MSHRLPPNVFVFPTAARRAAAPTSPAHAILASILAEAQPIGASSTSPTTATAAAAVAQRIVGNGNTQIGNGAVASQEIRGDGNMQIGGR